jgi:hypothetical protein
MSASTAAVTKTPYTKFLEGLISTYSFPMPQPRPFSSDYLAAFKTYSKTNPVTLQLMEDLTNSRIRMLAAVSSNGDLAEQLIVVEQYLSFVHSLHESLMVALDAKQNVSCDRDIAFEWTLYLNSRPPFRSSSLVLEMIMLYHMKAMIHYRTAQNLLQTDYVSCAAEAGKQFLQAASVYDMLQTNISNTKWARQFHPKEINPPECSANVCGAMSLYCRERAQATALVKAIAENKMSPMVKTRLSLGVSLLASQSLDQWTHSVPPYVKKEAWVYVPLIAAIGSDREVFRALAQHFLALHCMDDAANAGVGGKQLGQALSCTALAKVLLQEQKFPYYEVQQGGLPQISQFPYTGLAHLRDIIVYLQSQWDETAPVWDRENRMIYFQPQPRTVEEYVVPISAEAIVANPPVFKDIEPNIVPFIDPPKPKSVFSSFFNNLTGGGNKSASSGASASASATDASGAAVAVAVPDGSMLSASMLTGDGVPDQQGIPSPGLTDEEFARELHRRLNMDSAHTTAATSSSPVVPSPSAPPAAPDMSLGTRRIT